MKNEKEKNILPLVAAQNSKQPQTAGQTPHSPVILGNPFSPTAQYMGSGIDTLHLNIFARNLDNSNLYKTLSHLKLLAQSNKHQLLKITCAGDAIVLYKGQSHYSNHIKTVYFDLFINCSPHSQVIPNACCQFSSEALWLLGIDKAKDLIVTFINELGGIVERLQVNRIDLYADFSLSDGLNDNFLKSHIVSSSRISKCFYNDGKLESFYIGTRGRILCRIYNKTAELIKHHKGFGHYEGIAPELLNNIWRIEFEIGRKILRTYNINTFDDISADLGGLWNYLTTKWLSLRIPNNSNTSRRPVHPWWQQVQQLAPSFGTVTNLSRKESTKISCPDWYVAHIAGCLPAFAVLSGCKGLPLTLEQLSAMLTQWWQSRDFDDACRAKAVQLGISETISNANDIVNGGEL